MLIFNLHCQLVLCISSITKYVAQRSRPNVKFSLYLKKAGLANRNIVHIQKSFYVVSVSAFIFYNTDLH